MRLLNANFKCGHGQSSIYPKRFDILRDSVAFVIHAKIPKSRLMNRVSPENPRQVFLRNDFGPKIVINNLQF